jgi:hypothetical protein
MNYLFKEKVESNMKFLIHTPNGVEVEFTLKVTLVLAILIALGLL